MKCLRSHSSFVLYSFWRYCAIFGGGRPPPSYFLPWIGASFFHQQKNALESDKNISNEYFGPKQSKPFLANALNSLKVFANTTKLRYVHASFWISFFVLCIRFNPPQIRRLITISYQNIEFLPRVKSAEKNYNDHTYSFLFLFY